MSDIKLFNQTSKATKKILNEIEHSYKFIEKNEIFMFRGEEIDGLILLISGKLGAFMSKDNGDVHKIETLTDNSIVASAFIFGNNNFLPVDLIAESKCKILKINRKNLLKLFTNHNDILVDFLDEISTKTQFLTHKIWKSINNKTIKEKVVDFINEHRTNDLFILPISIKELSEKFNTTRPSLSRVLKEMIENEEIKKIDKGKYLLLSKFFLLAK